MGVGRKTIYEIDPWSAMKVHLQIGGELTALSESKHALKQQNLSSKIESLGVAESDKSSYYLFECYTEVRRTLDKPKS